MSEKKKLIDEKGKLFGKVNIIDLIVLALILVVVVIVGTKLLNRSSERPSEQAGTNLSYTVTVSRVTQEVYEAVEAELAKGGDSATLMANGDKLAGCYVDSISSVPHMETVEKADGTMANSEEPGYVDINFSIQAVVTNRITQAVGTQEVRVGKAHIVKTVGFELINGIIMSVDVVPAAG